MMAIVMFALYDVIYKIFPVEICMTFTLTFRMYQGQRSNINMPNKSPCTTFYMMAKVMLSIYLSSFTGYLQSKYA